MKTCKVASTPEERLLCAIFGEPTDPCPARSLISNLCFKHWWQRAFHGWFCKWCWEERWQALMDWWHERK
jgi:hypothetical protein